jgi:serine/threonine protein kinase
MWLIAMLRIKTDKRHLKISDFGMMSKPLVSLTSGEIDHKCSSTHWSPQQQLPANERPRPHISDDVWSIGQILAEAMVLHDDGSAETKFDATSSSPKAAAAVAQARRASRHWLNQPESPSSHHPAASSAPQSSWLGSMESHEMDSFHNQLRRLPNYSSTVIDMVCSLLQLDPKGRSSVDRARDAFVAAERAVSKVNHIRPFALYMFLILSPHVCLRLAATDISTCITCTWYGK